MFFSWRKWLKRPTKLVRKPASIRPRLEALEDRTTPAAITVTTTSDVVAVDNVVSLREAIRCINAGQDLGDVVANVTNGGYGVNDTIYFSIGGGVKDIQIANSALPTITTKVVINAGAPVAHPDQVIELDGSQLTGTAGINGLTINASNVAVRGYGDLELGNFTGNGVEIDGGGSNVIVAGCLIGTDSQAHNLANTGFGVVINGASGNNIGWESGAGYDAATDHNFISRNGKGGIEITGTAAQSNVVGNNDIGASNTIASDVTGNGNMGVYVTQGAHGNTIGVNVTGNVTKGASNVIVGNAAAGVIIDHGSHDNQVAGNYIGIRWGVYLSTAGEVVANGGYGVEIHWLTDDSATEKNLIGGTDSRERNVISGNTNGGVLITGPQASNNSVLGDYIGTALDGSDGQDVLAYPTGNGGDGVLIQDGSDNQIGTPGGLNLISGNFGNGVHIQGQLQLKPDFAGSYMTLSAPNTLS